MPDEGARMTPEALVIFKTLDFCKSPTVPVGYPIVGKLDQSTRTTPTVNETGQQVFTALSRVIAVIGNEAGIGGGVMSMVNKGMCKPIKWSQTVRMEGNWAVMNSVEMMMNCMGPEGTSNTLGTLVYVKCTAAAVVAPHGEIEVARPTDSQKSDEGDQPDDEGDEGSENQEPSPEEQEVQKEIEQTEKEIAQAEQEAAAAEAEAAKLDEELALELAQGAADAAGVLDPTPISDATSASIAIARGDYLGAGLSGLSMIPYLGDAIAKPIKAVKATKAVAKLRSLLKAAKAAAAKAKQLLGKLKDKLNSLRKKLKDLKQGKKGKTKKGGEGEIRVVNEPPKPLGRGSTGRTEPKNLKEKLAMEETMSNPEAGTPLKLKKGMTDPRWPKEEGWVKMGKNTNGVEVHYVRNINTGQVDDFKFVP